MVERFIITTHRLKRFNLAFSCNVSVQENRFKLIHRWYLTPRWKAKMFHHKEGICWWCQSPHADYMHMWWPCVRIYEFCGNVNNKIKEITKMVTIDSKSYAAVRFWIWRNNCVLGVISTYVDSGNIINSQSLEIGRGSEN